MRYFCLFVCLLITIAGFAQHIKITSPERKIVLSVSNSNSLTYQIAYKGKTIIKDSQLGFKLNKPIASLTSFEVVKIDSLVHDETWTPVWGEVNKIRDHYKELRLALQDQTSKIQVQIVFRVFDDGVGFRYEFPAQVNKYLIVDEELTQFSVTGDHKTFWIPGDYDTNEYLYNTTNLSQ
jgi:hypothetical protein